MTQKSKYRVHQNSIVRMRYRKGWNIETLSEKSNIPQFTMEKIELGTMEMSANVMLKLSRLFNCTVEELLSPCRFTRTPSISKTRQNRGLEHGRGRLRWAGKLPIPKNAHPLVKQLFKTLNTHKKTIPEVSHHSGIPSATISSWRYNRNPNLLNFEAALNSIGYSLKIVRQKTHD